MASLLAGAIWAALIAWLLTRALNQFAAHRAGSLDSTDESGPTDENEPRRSLPHVAIVVPARNEIANIELCLAGLTGQSGIDVRIIVVDDESRDGTGEAVARAASTDPRIVLESVGPLPRGWMGKPRACWHGALRADTPWLCFVDADVRAEPGLVAAAIGAAEQQGIDLLSLSPFQELGSFWERLVIPAGLVLIACAMDLRRVDDPAAPEISANGQFLLIRRSVYFAVGGHAAVRGEICEDKALAARVKRGGRRFRLLGAERLARTRMYTDLASLREGLAKNATEIIGDSFDTMAASAAAMVLAWAAPIVPALTLWAAINNPTAATTAGTGLAWLGSAAVLGVQFGTVRYFRIPWHFALLFPLAYTAVAALAWHSAALRRRGRVGWKGRFYDIARKPAPGRP
jgi:chlorobactene glucosyltransferase